MYFIYYIYRKNVGPSVWFLIWYETIKMWQTENESVTRFNRFLGNMQHEDLKLQDEAQISGLCDRHFSALQAEIIR